MSNIKHIPGERLLSLDFYRGLTMFLLIAEFTHLFNSFITPELNGSLIHTIGLQLHHAEWIGLHFWDLIQPFFMFIVGVAMPFSYAKRMEKGDSHTKIRSHIFKRSFLLLVLGWALYCISPGKITFNFQNVLAQLSVTIIIAFLIMRLSVKNQIIISILILLFTELIYRTFWIEGYNQPFVPDRNFGAWFDMLISGQLSNGHWVSFNAFPTSAHTIWGVLAGKLLMSDKSNKRKVSLLVITGVAGLIIGFGFSSFTPIIKRISSTTFVFASGGWALLALALSYWLVDILKWQKGILFFVVVGMNPLFIYLFAHVGGANFIKNILKPFTNALFAWSGEMYLNIITSIIILVSLWGICYWMYRRKIFIKI